MQHFRDVTWVVLLTLTSCGGSAESAPPSGTAGAGPVGGSATVGGSAGASIVGGSVSGGTAPTGGGGASAGSAGGSRAGSAGNSGSAGMGVSGSGTAGESSSCVPWAPQQGLTSGVGTPFQGVVKEVTADSLTLETEAGEDTLRWHGASLSLAFPLGTEVEIEFVEAVVGFGGGWTVVRSTSAVAATLWGGAQTTGYSNEVGATASFNVPAGFPELRWVNAGCCGSPRPVCDYGEMEATLGTEMVSVERGETVIIGAFTITNFGGRWQNGGMNFEWQFQAGASVLGPASPEP